MNGEFHGIKVGCYKEDLYETVIVVLFDKEDWQINAGIPF